MEHALQCLQQHGPAERFGRLAGGVAQQMQLIVNPHHPAVPPKKAILVDNAFVGQDAVGVGNHSREVFGMHLRAPSMRLQGLLDDVAKQAFKVWGSLTSAANSYLPSETPK